MTKNKWVNLLLEAIGCFISALGIYSFAVAAGVVVLCACLLVLSVPFSTACSGCPSALPPLR